MVFLLKTRRHYWSIFYLDGFVRDIDENQFEAGEVPLGRGGD